MASTHRTLDTGQVDVGKGDRVRANHRALLVLLLAVLTMAATPASYPDLATRNPTVALAPDNPATHHDLRDWLPRAARHVLSTPAPDSWWAVYARSTGVSARLDRSPGHPATGSAVAVGVAAAPSTRAPPARVR